jgi:conjugal transfer ATP-binding protein TraC
MANLLESTLIKLFKPYFVEESPGELYQAGAKPPSVRRLEEVLKTHRLADLLPYESYDDDFDLFINADSYGFALEVSTAVSMDENILGILSSMFTGQDIDKDTVIQYCLYASPDVMPKLTRWANSFMSDPLDESDEAKRNANIFRVMVRKRIDHLLKGVWQSMSDETSMMVRDFRAFITVQKPLPGGRSENVSTLLKQKMKRHRNAMMSIIKTAGLSSRVLNVGEFVDLLDTMINSKTVKRERKPYQDDALIKDQVVNKDNLLLVGRDDLYMNNPDRSTNISIFGVDTYPGEWAGWGNGELIGSITEDARRISTPFLITMTIQYPDQIEQISQAKMKHNRAVQMSESPIAKTVTSWHDKRREWEFVTRKIEEGHTNVKVNYQIVLFSSDENKENAEGELMTVFKACKWNLYKQRFTLLPAFIMSLPMGASQTYVNFALDKKMFKTMPSWSTVNIAPFLAEYKGSPNPLQLLVGYRGQLSNFNPWDNTQGNFNVAVAARSGAGKSVFMQDFILSVLGQGGRAWVFDRGRSFEQICHLLGTHYSTQFLVFDGSEKVSLNPFTNVHEWDGDIDGGSERVMIHNLLIQMASRDGESLPAERQTWLDIALTEVWSRKGCEAEITDIYTALHDNDDVRYQDLADALFPFTREGVFGHYFTGPSTIDLTDDFVVLEMKELDDRPQLQTIVLLILMMRIEQTMYSPHRDRRKQVCLIDEAWKLLSYGNAATFVEEGYRTARKYGGSFVAISQGINDFYKNPTTLACLENSDQTLLLAQKEESIKQLANSDRLPGGKESIPLIRKLKMVKGLYSSCASINPEGMAVVRLIVDKFSEMLFTTNDVEVGERQDLLGQGLPLMEALEYQVKLREEQSKHD